TTSSMLVSLTERTQKSIMQFANGSPNEKPYEDVSALLRQVLSTDRASQKKAKAKPRPEGQTDEIAEREPLDQPS
ncbi:MAG: hypothetical protein IKK39_03365, partial [Thermoguttaceae bacterium]|nr:hypothetical protein [Thermoguttaceae bacterium]